MRRPVLVDGLSTVAEWIVDDLRWINATKIPDGLYVELTRPRESAN
jgi:hypothetical protein